MGTEGKLRASWISNTKKLSFKDESGRFYLLPLKVQHVTAAPVARGLSASLASCCCAMGDAESCKQCPQRHCDTCAHFQQHVMPGHKSAVTSSPPA